MIDALAIAKILATLMGCWATGYATGATVAWVRAIRGAA